MKEIVVLSGKGGTGKTSLTASFALLAEQKISLGDCDVEAANLALLITGNNTSEESFVAGQTAFVNSEACTACGACVEVCRYAAIIIPADARAAIVDDIPCEGCRACSVVCPTDAISFSDVRVGTIFQRKTAVGPMIHAELGIAQDNSGKLVSRVRKETRSRAEASGIELAILDGPPGIGCPVHAAITGVSLVVAVTEASSSGLHDLERLLELCKHFNAKAVVIINKYDLCVEVTEKIERLAEELNIRIVGKIPFDENIPRALARREAPIAIPRIRETIQQIWNDIKQELGIAWTPIS